MSNILAQLLSNENSILYELSEEEFDLLFNTEEYQGKLAKVKTIDNVKVIIKELRIQRLLFGEDWLKTGKLNESF